MRSTDLAHDSFKYNIVLMKTLGLYPFDSWSNIYNSLYCFFFYIFTVITPLLPTTKLILDKETDLEVICQSCYLTTQLAVLILKLLPFKLDADGVKKTIFDLNADLFNNYSPDQSYIIAGIIKTCNRIFWIYFFNILSAVIIFIYRSLFEESKEYFNSWVPFNFQEQWMHKLISVFIYTGITNGAMGNVTVDALVSCLIYQAAGQLRILKDTLTHLNQRVQNEMSRMGKLKSNSEKEKLKAEIIYKQICICIDHYDAIYRYVKSLESTYSSAIFSQFMGSIVVICISCFQLSTLEPMSLSFFTVLIFTTALLSQLFLFCYAGTLLYEESNTVINSIYMGEWYTFEKKSKNALFILMERSKRPIRVTAGKLLDLSLDTFTMIIRRSYSLLAVLQNN